jgi:hypothetical protein
MVRNPLNSTTTHIFYVPGRATTTRFNKYGSATTHYENSATIRFSSGSIYNEDDGQSRGSSATRHSATIIDYRNNVEVLAGRSRLSTSSSCCRNREADCSASEVHTDKTSRVCQATQQPTAQSSSRQDLG